MLSYIFYFFLAYMLYQLVFRFILPLYRTTKQVRRGFRDMQNRMSGQHTAASQQTASKAEAKENRKPVGDYIEFEEVREK